MFGTQEMALCMDVIRKGAGTSFVRNGDLGHVS